jgi:hypothetical protein
MNVSRDNGLRGLLVFDLLTKAGYTTIQFPRLNEAEEGLEPCIH